MPTEGEKLEKITRYETTVGRALLSEILPPGLPFSYINKPLKKKEISRIIMRASAAAACAKRSSSPTS